LILDEILESEKKVLKDFEEEQKKVSVESEINKIQFVIFVI
jgi:hypothetical protein